MLELRPYQQGAAKAVLEDWAGDCPDTLVCLPTGTGKTATFTALMAAVWKPGVRVIVMAHTEELVEQPKSAFERWFSPQHPGAKIGVVRGQQRDYRADVIFCTVQTLSRAGGKALYQILKYGKIDYFICDETHHIVADTYMQVKACIQSNEGWQAEIDKLTKEVESVGHLNRRIEDLELDDNLPVDLRNELASLKRSKDSLDRTLKEKRWMKKFSFQQVKTNPDLLTLGVTATPQRADDVDITAAFPKVMERNRFTYTYSIREAIRDGWLAPFEPLYLQAVVAGDERIPVLQADNWGEILFLEWMKICNPDMGLETVDDIDGKEFSVNPTLCFFPTIKDSKKWIEWVGTTYSVEGIHVDATNTLRWCNEQQKMVRYSRSDAIEDLRVGRCNLLSNVEVLTEGVDFPRLEIGIIARPTQSVGAYVQMLGRYLRLDLSNPDKKAKILHVGHSGHSIANIMDAIGTHPDQTAVERFEKKLEKLMGGIPEDARFCPKCELDQRNPRKVPLERIKGTVLYSCPDCFSEFEGQEVGSRLPDLFQESGNGKSGIASYTKVLQLFSSSEVAWHCQDGFWTVGLGVGGRGKEWADRTLIVAPPGSVPSRPDNYNLIVIMKQVLEKQGRIYKFGQKRGAFVGSPGTIDEIMEIAGDMVMRYQEPILSDKSKRWRKQPAASERQLKLLKRLGSEVEGKSFTKDQAARVITYRLATSFLRNKGVID